MVNWGLYRRLTRPTAAFAMRSLKLFPAPMITDDSKPIKIKYLGAAYFKLLDKNDELKKILALGKRVGFKTPSGAVILIDQDGADEMPEAELTKLFTPAK